MQRVLPLFVLSARFVRLHGRVPSMLHSEPVLDRVSGTCALVLVACCIEVI